MSKPYFKIVDDDGRGGVKTLFHAVNGSKRLPPARWIEADVKPVSDGTNGTVYQSGFHVFDDLNEAYHYLNLFKNVEPKRIVRAKIGDKWPKSHSRANVWLTDRIFIEGIVCDGPSSD